jgi:hypothetical protein
MKAIKQRNPSAPSVLPGSNLTCHVLRRTVGRNFKIVILLLMLSSCATMNINGVALKKPQKRTATRKDTGYFIAAGLIGYAATLHFKTKKE